ncbi:MAG: RNA-binding transcriptional accessory protein [Candidatus Riflebacteria bacterium]|nr:RNA-binding transcriptional accessory protein [Candidatus Riflebacteria bacterium]
MLVNHARRIANELGISIEQVEATAALLDDGGTVPFIARYRKERTGSLDELAIQGIRDWKARLIEFDARRESIRASLIERNLLSDELSEKISAVDSIAALEDIYLPFRPKRRTRAMIAREKGLEPLADIILLQATDCDPRHAAGAYISPDKGVENIDDAIAGARDIIAESISENADVRNEMRSIFMNESFWVSAVAKGREEDGAKFRDYFAWTESVAKSPGHRVLAMLRGESEGVLKLTVRLPENRGPELLRRRFIKGRGPSSDEVATAIEDGFKRLLAPSMETEIRHQIKIRADEEAVRVFVSNLRELLMAAPLGRKAVLAIDPGIRTGCKIACLDAQGKLLDHTVIFTSGSERQTAEAAKTLLALADRYSIEAIAVGNGTAGRETEMFVRSLPWPRAIPVVPVNESGASIYSASEVAREEFPNEDLTVRGAVSIGRRLMDPLAELVKIDPKSIGVGQYQHDVDQKLLKAGLDDLVSSCVNAVGVEVNTASKQLLQYVSGLGPQQAKNIIAWRDENGPFTSRSDLRKVPRLGPKAFEQAAGFLRVGVGTHPLDSSAVHPESYAIVESMAKDLGCVVRDLLADETLRARVNPERYINDRVGLPTLNDILDELARPGRDPRAAFEIFSFADGVHAVSDLHPGQKLPGIVTNVTRFGAFVDVGVHQDGLVHVSELADRFVKEPSEVVKVGQHVSVSVIDIDAPRNRISLSMRSMPGAGRARKALSSGWREE